MTECRTLLTLKAFAACRDSVWLRTLSAELDTVSMFIAAESRRRLAVSTIERRVVAIACDPGASAL